MDIRRVQYGEDALLEYVQLFRDCFPATDKFNCDYLDWLYRCNPDGPVVGYDARDGDRLAAHYVCVPARALVGGEAVRVLLSLNTATHPNYQGKGLFTKLAELTYATGAELGYDCVYGVANANSTPGFIRRLNFQLVSPLRACVGIGRLGVDFDRLGLTTRFRRLWTEDALAWRCASPVNPVVAHREGDHTTLLAPAIFGGVCSASAELEGAINLAIKGGFATLLRLFIGMVPTGARRHAFYVDIPDRLRPVPLNLIYRSLSGRIMAISPDDVFFTFLDFDAY